MGKVLVIGGGVAGMTAAHELAERGYQVTVLEHNVIAGGKARSMHAYGTALGDSNPPPGEHGFRFFPSFYRHVPDTMKRIPYRDNADGVFGNLVPATRAEVLRVGEAGLKVPLGFGRGTRNVRLLLRDLFRNDLHIPLRDWLFFTRLLVRLMSSCEERRYADFEYESWWDFSQADRRSEEYRTYLADGLTRTLVAAKARQMSARTGGYILLQLLRPVGHGGSVDRVLNGPTSERWITPWLDHLRTLGVDYRLGITVTGLRREGRRIVGVSTVDREGTTGSVEADIVIVAVPKEVLSRLATEEIREVDPSLANLDMLVTRWMNGVIFYLREDVPIVHGHVIYMNSQWALTSISQHQFWSAFTMADLADGQVKGILSVDVSDWTTPGTNGKAAQDCTREEIAKEVWAQVCAHLNRSGHEGISDDDSLGVFIDPDITYAADGGVGPSHDANAEPLLINTAGSWVDRPDVTTAFENMYLASDYVRTFTDLATMEGANEAARRAVNAILAAEGSSATRCGVWPLHDNVLFRPLRALDRWRFRKSAAAAAASGRPTHGPGGAQPGPTADRTRRP